MSLDGARLSAQLEEEKSMSESEIADEHHIGCSRVGGLFKSHGGNCAYPDATYTDEVAERRRVAQELAALRGENERLRAKVTELSDEAYEYAEQVERLKEWQRQMVQKAADNSLDGYRELGAKCAALEERAEKAEARGREVEKQKDGAYAERDRLVAALSKIFPAHMQRHPSEDAEWEDEWRWIVVVYLPAGQATWHIHDSELSWFDHLNRDRYLTPWDGHTVEEKYARLDQVELVAPPPADGGPEDG